MGAITRAALAGRWRAVVLIGLAAALLFGGGIAALAGARRSSTAIDGALAYSTPEDVFGGRHDEEPFDAAAVDALPEVLAASYEGYVAMAPIGPDGRAQLDLVGSINPYLYAPASGPPGAINRLRIVRGRDLDPAAPLEVVIDEELASARGLAVGSHLPMAAFAAAQAQDIFSSKTGNPTVEPEGPTLDLTVVGIARMPVDLHPGEESHTTSFGGTKDIYLTPAFYERYGDQIGIFGGPEPRSPQAIRLVHGLADLDAFRADVAALPGGDALTVDVSDSDAMGSVITARRAVSVETAALVALAAVLALAGVVLVGHALARLARSATGDLEILRAIGLGPAQLLAVTALPGLVASGVGAAGALVVAIGASTLTPIGLAREAEVSLGVHVDGAVGLGTLATGDVLGANAFLGACPTARAVGAAGDKARAGGPALADRLGALGLPFGPTMGARFAASRGERSRAPLRSALGATALGILVATGVATYVASLGHLAGDVRAQGANWDLAMGNINLSDYGPDDYKTLSADPDISGFAAVSAPQGRGFVNGADVPIAGLDEISGGVAPQVLEGRLPHALGEVVLGHRSAEHLGVGIGDHVTLDYAGATTQAEVVGTAVLGPSITPTMLIGDGAIVTVDQMRALAGEQPVNFLLIDVRPGTSIDDAIARLQPDWGRNVARPVVAADVVNLRRVRGVPIALASALALAAALLIGAALVVSVRQRRRDIGVLRAIGATRGQISSALSWQALWVYFGAAVIGVPLGVIAGRVMWREVADGIGTLLGPVVPVLQVVEIVIGGLALVTALVVLPARAATRLRPAEALRTE
jgi:ABC-type lipoprotein release transport system permease subunit